MPSRADVTALNRTMGEAAAGAKRDLERFLATLGNPSPLELKRELEWFFPAVIAEYGDVAGVIAADWYEYMTGEYATLAEEDPPDRVLARMRWGIGPAFEDNQAQALANLQLIADELVKRFGRDTVMQSAIRNGRRFARVPQGSHTCAWCLMLASRGFAYRSASHAGRFAKFHGDCDCQIVMDDGRIPEGYDPDSLYGMYASVHEHGDNDRAVAAKLREAFDLK